MWRDVSGDTWTCLAILRGYLYSYNMSVADGCVLGLAVCVFLHMAYCYYYYYPDIISVITIVIFYYYNNY